MKNYSFTSEQMELLLALLHKALEPSLVKEKKEKISNLPLLKLKGKSYLFEPEFQHYNLEIGEFYENHSQWELAMEHLERAVEIEPENTVATIKLAVSYLHIKNIDKSREYFEKCEKLLPHNSIIKCILGYIKFYQGQEREGVKTIRELIKNEPENIFFYFFLCEIYLTWQQYDLAIEEMGKVLSVYPGNPEAHFTLGRIHREKRDFDLAIKHLKTSIELDPSSIMPYNALGDIHLSLEDFHAAYHYYTRVVELKPGYGEAYNKLGLVCSGKKEYDSAITYYKKALKNLPYNIDYNSNISLACIDKGYMDKALEYFAYTIESKTEDRDLYESFVDFIKRNTRTDMVIKNCLKSLEGNPGNLNSINTLAGIYKSEGEYDKAIEFYKKAISINPEDEWRYSINTGDILLRTSSIENALPCYFRALEKHPVPIVYAKLARVFETYRPDLAIKYYQEVLKSNIDDEGFYYYNIATAYFLQHSLDNAMVHYKLAMTMDRRRETLCQYFIGNCALMLGNLKLARNLMDKFMISEPNMAAPHYIIGSIQERLGETEKALWYYKKALEKDPSYFKARYRAGLLYYKKGDKNMAMEYFLNCFDTPYRIDEKFTEELEDFILELGKENPDYLLNALKSTSQGVRLQSAKCLAKIGEPQGALELLDFFIKDRMTTGNIRESLKSFRNKNIEKKLKNIVVNKELKGKIPECIIEIIALMGDIGHKSFIPILLNIIEEEHNIFKSAAVEALVKLRQKGLFEILSKQMIKEEKPLKTSAIIATGKLGDKKYITFLSTFLKDRDPEIRACTVSAAGDIKDWKSLNILIEACDDASEIVKNEAAISIKKFLSLEKLKIGKNVEKKVIQALLKLLREKNIMIKLHTIEALEFISSELAVEDLIKCLKAPEYHIRAKAAELLGVMGDKRALEPLIESLEDFYPIVRAKAAASLGKIKEPSASVALIYVLRNDFHIVRKEAALALGKIGEKAAIERLCSLLSDRNMREEAIEALGNMGEVPVDVKNSLLKLWYDCGEMEKVTLALALYRLGETDKKKFLLKTGLSKRENLRKKALKALDELSR